MSSKSQGFSLDMAQILEYQRNRPPYLMIDYVEQVVPGVSSSGYKQLSPDDWFFECHFPDDPNMPGMLQVEALMQLAALMILTLDGNKGKVMYMSSASDIKLSRKILSGDRLEMVTKLNSFRRGIAKCSGWGNVNGKNACRANFVLVLPDLIESPQVKRLV